MIAKSPSGIKGPRTDDSARLPNDGSGSRLYYHRIVARVPHPAPKVGVGDRRRCRYPESAGRPKPPPPGGCPIPYRRSGWGTDDVFRHRESTGRPNPPPPGVSMIKRSPGFTRSRHIDSNSSRGTGAPSRTEGRSGAGAPSRTEGRGGGPMTLSLPRIHRFRPHDPAPPPSSPYGGRVRRCETIVTSSGARNSISRTMPSPPGHRPAPPDPCRTAQRTSRTG